MVRIKHPSNEDESKQAYKDGFNQQIMKNLKMVSFLYDTSESKGAEKILKDIAKSISGYYGETIVVNVSFCRKFMCKEIRIVIEETAPGSCFDEALRRYLSHSEFIGDRCGVEIASDYNIVANAVPEGMELKKHWRYLFFSDGRRHIENNYNR